MNPRADPADDFLLQQPWLPVCIDSCQLLVKSWFGDAEYHILLTDMQGVWEERMDAAAIERRAQELNRRLRAAVQAFFSHLREAAEPWLSGGGSGEAQMCVWRRDGAVTLKLKSELAGLPFHWEFHCGPAPVSLVCAQLVRPLLAMSRLMHRQVEELGELLARKDEEIQDYRENGATLSRERLQTDVFNKQLYTEDFIQKNLPVLRSDQSHALGFNTDLQQLYAAVTAHCPTPHKRRRPQENHGDPDWTEPGPPEPEPPAQTTVIGPDGGDPENQNPGTPVGPGGAAQVRAPAVGATRPAERQSSKLKKKKVGLFR
ncbi:non-homologous end-joining factor 1 [Poecilia reticulata]|uniref:Non-homologous end-joining factor 1 n=1 Tax=Poecilia reticulata TaxID=8081 RepID=A0A3P9PIU2_POERE|nr:PREDICTED: non-homologous end-joining factor 1 [Poecilia reticulata]XP_017159263.1 PREDICTED: non-homologous end-joining factor 1 [Poecilia reticulata]